MKDLLALAMERAEQLEEVRDKPAKRKRSPAMHDALTEAWSAIEKKDFDSFAESFENAVRIHSAGSSDDN